MSEMSVAHAPSRAPRFVVGLVLGLAILAVLGVYLAVLSPLIMLEVEADRLFNYAFFKDLFQDGGSLASWNLGQHSDFFPDKVFAGAAFLLTRQIEGWLQIFTLFIVVLYVAVAWVFFALYRRAAFPQAAANSGPLLWALLVTLLSLMAWQHRLFFLFLRDLAYPGHHVAATLCGLLGGMLAIDAFDGTGRQLARRLPAAMAILFLATISDKIVVPVALPSFLVAVVYYCVATRRLSLATVAAGLAVIGAAGAAYVFADDLNNRVARVSDLPLTVHPDKLLVQARVFYHALFAPQIPLQFWCALGLTLYAIVLLVVHAAALVGVALGRRPALSADRARTSTFIVFMIATAVLNPLAIIAVGGMEEEGHARESVATVFCLLWAVAAQLDRGPLLQVPRWAIAGLTAVIALLSCLAVRDELAARPWNAKAETPPLLQCIRHYQASYPLTRGVGFHWDTLPITLMSEGRITILTVIEEARVWHWINNIDWYAPRADKQPFSFMVLDPVINDKAVAARVGAPAHVLRCADAGPGAGAKTIWLFDPPEAERLTGWITEQYQQIKSGLAR